MGVISGAISYGCYLLWVLLIGFSTGWQSFFRDDLSVRSVGLLSWEVAAAIGVLESSLVPVCTLRYEKIKYLFAYVFVSLLSLVWLYGTTLAVWLTVYPSWCPLIGWDSLYYFMIVLPVGSVIGTMVAIGIHIFMKS